MITPPAAASALKTTARPADGECIKGDILADEAAAAPALKAPERLADGECIKGDILADGADAAPALKAPERLADGECIKGDILADGAAAGGIIKASMLSAWRHRRSNAGTRRGTAAQRQHKTCSFRTKGGRAYALGYAIKAMLPVTLAGCALTFLHASNTLKPARQRWLGPSGSIQERKIKQKECASACKDAGDPG